ncbi:hypothetical protein [Methylobacterium fujisawaense]|uniref:hypothetical protein n=1 Tax=Methylobacterium fujisawaense TaxID=107400 RepID=UPI00313F1F1A
MATETTPVPDLAQRFAEQVTETVIPFTIEVVLAFSTGTVNEALAEIRDGVDGNRNTLRLMSDAIDASAADTLREADAQSFVNALVFG